MKIYLGADHRGYELKDKIEAYLAKRNYPVEDVGALGYDAGDDFPQFASAAALKIIGSDDDDPRAILLCGGGQGMAMAANRFGRIRAAVVADADAARTARYENDANVLSLPADKFDGNDDWQAIVDMFLTTKFSGKERYVRRNKQLDELI
ncbi:MAG: RpiB/LacA/LacB family sugar-phosphate isomerase [Candidatus Nomurabacteria bacterium]|jgi:ribose 5-phosphate isomerase B|nr:RpiB/LacA/LacB family sugar-phosphate isomerase [Candidatus Nomurabacteria bacterium]